MSYSYDSHFMAYADSSSRHSAQTVSKLLCGTLDLHSVLDVGCARGTWLGAWRENGIDDVFGVDGSYVDTATLVIPRERFMPSDLAQPFDLQRTFDLVQTLEVAEHIRADCAERFVDNLVRHSRGYVLFSAAPPGQGGEYHVNEQPYDYWREKFRSRGYEAYYFVRPTIAADKKISFWYRYNVLLFVRQDRAAGLPEAIKRTHIDGSRPVEDVSPFVFRARKAIVRLLPYTVQRWLAQVKARLEHQRARNA